MHLVFSLHHHKRSNNESLCSVFHPVTFTRLDLFEDVVINSDLFQLGFFWSKDGRTWSVIYCLTVHLVHGSLLLPLLDCTQPDIIQADMPRVMMILIQLFFFFPFPTFLLCHFFFLSSFLHCLCYSLYSFKSVVNWTILFSQWVKCQWLKTQPSFLHFILKFQ